MLHNLWAKGDFISRDLGEGTAPQALADNRIEFYSQQHFPFELFWSKNVENKYQKFAILGK